MEIFIEKVIRNPFFIIFIYLLRLLALHSRVQFEDFQFPRILCYKICQLKGQNGGFQPCFWEMSKVYMFVLVQQMFSSSRTHEHAACQLVRKEWQNFIIEMNYSYI